MKKILIALAVILAVQVADAQTKSVDAVKKSVESAEADAQNPKKNTKVATWLKLATSYVDAYNAPTGNVILNSPRMQIQMMLGQEKPSSSESVVIDGMNFKKEVYANKNLYFDETDVLRIVEVTKPVYEDALASALNAYVKAYEVDAKKSKEKDIKAGIASINQKYTTDAFNAYQLGELSKASELFALAADAMNTAPLSQVDTNAIYNAGFTAWMAQDYQTAKKHFEDCLGYGYYYDGGEVFAKLADIYKNLGSQAEVVTILEEGFTKFPQSQSILIGLINYYLENKQDPKRLFDLIDLAKQNEPNNASLYYVEGNVYKELGDIASAANAYAACASINPEYEYGYIGAGVMYYELAVKLSEEASNEFDDAKYNALVEQFEKALLDAIDPFEKAYATTKDETLKVSIAEYLKNIYYRFISKGAEYEAGYKKYDEIVKGAN